MNVIFFGSTHDSVIVCDVLFSHSKKLDITLQAVVTQPAKPIGRNRVITQTPVEIWAHAHTITCLTFETQKEKPWLYAHEDHVVLSLSTCSPDLVISASYGQKIPEPLIEHARYGGMNVHPSLLPRWRGTDPIPWTILAGDEQTGVTLVTLSKKFDEGIILAQQKIPLDSQKTPEEIRSHLFSLGATLLVAILPEYCAGKHIGKAQDASHATYARRLTKEDGYIPWNTLIDAVEGKTPDSLQGILSITNTSLPDSVVRAVRSLTPWPGIWSIVILKGISKRVKILEVHTNGGKLVIDTVQLEGKNPTPFPLFMDAYELTLDNLNT
jgi:methionyl-tRNA formyltransferase